MKMLNIDKVVPKEKKELNIGGTSYVVEPMTVANFVKTTQAADDLGENASVGEQVAATIDMVKRSVPTLPQEILDQLSLEQLQTIVAFIRGDAIAGVEEAAKAEGEEGK